MKLTSILWCGLGALSFANTDLESRHWFDGVLLPIVDFAFIVWGLTRLTLGGGGGSGSGGLGGGNWGDGGGGDCGGGDG